mgnify:CR=1 FL=1
MSDEILIYHVRMLMMTIIIDDALAGYTTSQWLRNILTGVWQKFTNEVHEFRASISSEMKRPLHALKKHAADRNLLRFVRIASVVAL